MQRSKFKTASVPSPSEWPKQDDREVETSQQETTASHDPPRQAQAGEEECLQTKKQPLDLTRSDKRHKTAVRMNDEILWRISKQLGPEWEELALTLDFNSMEIWQFKEDKPGRVANQIHAMLLQWRQNQPDGYNQTDALCTALKKVGRADLAIMLPDIVQTTAEGSQPNMLQKQTPAVATRFLRACCHWKVVLSIFTLCVLLLALFKIISRNPDVDSCEVAMKSHYGSTGSYVQRIPWVEDDKMHIKDIYTELLLETKSDDERGGEKNRGWIPADGNTEGRLGSYEDIFNFKTREDNTIKVTIFNGLAGRGKSTLLEKMAYDWAVGTSDALRKFKLVFLLKMNALEQSSELIDAIFDQLLPQDTSIDRMAIELFITSNPDKVLILLDGFDELMTTSLNETLFGSIFKILNRKKCRECYVVVTTRPSHFDRLVTNQLVQKPFTHVSVSGFAAGSIEEYLNKFYSGEPDRVQGLLEKIQSSRILSDLAESPVLLLMMSLLWRENFTLPQTTSRLYSEAVKYIFERKAATSAEMESKVLIEIGKIGLRGLLSLDQILSFKESEFEKDVLDMAIKVGLLTRKRVLQGQDTHNNIRFIHKTFQEFSAAKYLQSMLESDPQEFYKTLEQIVSMYPLHFEYLLRFCSGDNEACTNKILEIFYNSSQGYGLYQRVMGLHCYLESQSKNLPPKELIQTVIKESLSFYNFNNDLLSSYDYLLKRIAASTVDSGYNYLAKVQRLKVVGYDFERFGTSLSHAISFMTNLHTVTLSNCLLGANRVGDILLSLKSAVRLSELHFSGVIGLSGTAVSWSHHLKGSEMLQTLEIKACFLTGEDMKLIGESLSHLPNLVLLVLSNNENLGGSAAWWSNHLSNLKRLQKLDLSDCSLTGVDVIHITTSMHDLPNLAELCFSGNFPLRDSVALWASRLKHLRHLEKLDMSHCSLTDDDMMYIAKSLSDLPDLLELCFAGNDHQKSSEPLWSNLKNLDRIHLSNCGLKGKDVKRMSESVTKLHDQFRSADASN